MSDLDIYLQEINALKAKIEELEKLLIKTENLKRRSERIERITHLGYMELRAQLKLDLDTDPQKDLQSESQQNTPSL